MKRRGLGLLLAVLLILSSCLQDGGGEEYRYGTARVESVRVVSAAMSRVEFSVSGTFPVPCWEHTGAQVVEAGPQRYDVSLGGRIEKDIVCVTVVAAFERRVTVDVQEPGRYEFRFPREDAEAIVVPVRVS